MKIVILRGGSGSGKSFWAQKYGDIIISTDFYFLDELGVYHFDVTKLSEAHAETFKKFMEHCRIPPSDWSEDRPLRLVVDNTNTSIAEFGPYATVAAAYGHEVEIKTFVYDPVVAFRRNVHGSPLDVCMRQHSRLMRETDLIPSWWKHEFILAEEK